MAIAAVKVMAAGKSGLEALPHFIKELGDQGYRMLNPVGLDHDRSTINNVKGPIKDFCRTIQTEDSGEARNLVLNLNQAAYEQPRPGMADSPARIAGWCRTELNQYCQETLNEWSRHYAHERDANQTKSDPLLVIIPYCPEGPTSGTIGMYLGAMIRKTFQEHKKGSEVLVCGVELCPPTTNRASSLMSGPDGINTFRGYVARKEIMQGVALTKDPEDRDYRKCFDINLVFDAGSEENNDTTLSALDRAAAQATAMLFKGAANKGDVMEALDMLMQGRWEVNLIHVTSEIEYSPTITCRNYRQKLLWNRDPRQWEKTKLERKRKDFIQSAENILEETENNWENLSEEIKEWARNLRDSAEQLKEMKVGGISGTVRKKRKSEVRKKLAETIRQDEDDYAEVKNADKGGKPTDTPKFSEAPHSLDIKLAEEVRNRIAEEAAKGTPEPIAKLVGANYQQNLQKSIKEKIHEYLKRPDCDPAVQNSEAFFDQIVTVSIVTQGNRNAGPANECLHPEGLDYYLHKEIRGTAGSFSHMVFATENPFYWKPNGDRKVQYDIPTEYTLLIAAKVKKNQGFRDIRNYELMRKHYQSVIETPENLNNHLRYFGGRVPAPGEDLWQEKEEESSEPTKQNANQSIANEPVFQPGMQNGAYPANTEQEPVRTASGQN